jgi:hypothetical protein
MRLTVCTFAVATLFCAVTYEASQAAPIAPLGGLRTRYSNITQVYSHHGRGYSYHYWQRRYGIALIGGPRVSTIGPPMAQTAGAIGGI